MPAAGVKRAGTGFYQQVIVLLRGRYQLIIVRRFLGKLNEKREHY
jgi:hypothetical protein